MKKIFKSNIKLSNLKLSNFKYYSQITKSNPHNDSNKPTIDIVKQNNGLSNFLSKTYKYSALSVGTSLGAAYTLPYFIDFGFATQNPLLYVVGCGVCSVGSIYMLGKTKYDVQTKNNGLVSINSLERKLAYGGFLTSFTFMTIPFVITMNTISPIIIPIASGLALTTMGASSLFAYMKPKGSMLKYGGTISGALISLIGVQLAGLGAHFLGYHEIASLLHNVDTYFGIGVMAACNAYTTHRAIDCYEKKNPDHLGISINLYLEFMNMMIRFAEIVAKFKN
jgi:FtsH-binding integral membrane protein